MLPVSLICIIFCFDSPKPAPVIDRSCDLSVVRLPDDWKSDCLDRNGRLKSTLQGAKRFSCIRIAQNNRVLKSRCPDKASD